MPSPSRSLRDTLGSLAVGVVALGLSSAPAVAAESTAHLDNFAPFGLVTVLGVAGVAFAFGLFWVNVLVHLTVPWSRLGRFDRRTAAVVAALGLLSMGVVRLADLTMAVGWYPLPPVLATTAVGYASVVGDTRTTVAAVATTVAVFLATAAGLPGPFPLEGVFRTDLPRYLGLAVATLAAGCFTHAAGAVVATVRTRTT